ncbi:hypothetical protein E2C01_074147 [Portunus trituberculatus]|uniref:Uncharacterized protein n=1 Tax=Portunus trituberculatus TaxID=210409 RepID=A0A5B7I2M5_PORTR|nr:hypothetical protein [Portunus trituberculatus]
MNLVQFQLVSLPFPSTDTERTLILTIKGGCVTSPYLAWPPVLTLHSPSPLTCQPIDQPQLTHAIHPPLPTPHMRRQLKKMKLEM